MHPHGQPSIQVSGGVANIRRDRRKYSPIQLLPRSVRVRATCVHVCVVRTDILEWFTLDRTDQIALTNDLKTNRREEEGGEAGSMRKMMATRMASRRIVLSLVVRFVRFGGFVCCCVLCVCVCCWF